MNLQPDMGGNLYLHEKHRGGFIKFQFVGGDVLKYLMALHALADKPDFGLYGPNVAVDFLELWADFQDDLERKTAAVKRMPPKLWSYPG